MSSDKDKTKPEGTTEKAPLDSMSAGAEEPATSPTSIVGHPSEEHEKTPVDTVDLDEPTTLDDGQDSPMMGFAILVLLFANRNDCQLNRSAAGTGRFFAARSHVKTGRTENDRAANDASEAH